MDVCAVVLAVPRSCLDVKKLLVIIYIIDSACGCKFLIFTCGLDQDHCQGLLDFVLMAHKLLAPFEEVHEYTYKGTVAITCRSSVL